MMQMTRNRAAKIIGKITSLDYLKEQLEQAKKEFTSMAETVKNVEAMSATVTKAKEVEEKALAEVEEKIKGLMEQLSESTSKVITLQEEIVAELDAKKAKVHELTKDRFESVYEGGNDMLDPFVD